MKNFNIVLAGLIAVMAVACRNPRNISITTTVNADGSCVREVAEMVPDPIDSTAKDSVMRTSAQTYSDISEMGPHTGTMLSNEHISADAKMEKAFKWFYTEYTYTESISTHDSLMYPGLDAYFTADEISYLSMGTPNIMEGMSGMEVLEASQKLQDKLEKYSNNNFLDFYLGTIAKYYDRIENAPMSKEDFLASANRDTILKHCSNVIEANLVSNEPEGKFLDDIYKSNVFQKFFKENPECSNEIGEKIFSGIGPLSNIFIDYTLVMPGKIRKSNIGSISDIGTLHYHLAAENLSIHPVTIQATSRKANIWAYVASVLILAAAAGSFMWKNAK